MADLPFPWDGTSLPRERSGAAARAAALAPFAWPYADGARCVLPPQWAPPAAFAAAAAAANKAHPLPPPPPCGMGAAPCGSGRRYATLNAARDAWRAAAGAAAVSRLRVQEVGVAHANLPAYRAVVGALLSAPHAWRWADEADVSLRCQAAVVAARVIEWVYDAASGRVADALLHTYAQAAANYTDDWVGLRSLVASGRVARMRPAYVPVARGTYEVDADDGWRRTRVPGGVLLWPVLRAYAAFLQVQADATALPTERAQRVAYARDVHVAQLAQLPRGTVSAVAALGGLLSVSFMAAAAATRALLRVLPALPRAVRPTRPPPHVLAATFIPHVLSLTVAWDVLATCLVHVLRAAPRATEHLERAHAGAVVATLERTLTLALVALPLAEAQDALVAAAAAVGCSSSSVAALRATFAHLTRALAALAAARDVARDVVGGMYHDASVTIAYAASGDAVDVAAMRAMRTRLARTETDTATARTTAVVALAPSCVLRAATLLRCAMDSVAIDLWAACDCEPAVVAAALEAATSVATAAAVGSSSSGRAGGAGGSAGGAGGSAGGAGAGAGGAGAGAGAGGEDADTSWAPVQAAMIEYATRAACVAPPRHACAKTRDGACVCAEGANEALECIATATAAACPSVFCAAVAMRDVAAGIQGRGVPLYEAHARTFIGARLPGLAPALLTPAALPDADRVLWAAVSERVAEFDADATEALRAFVTQCGGGDAVAAPPTTDGGYAADAARRQREALQAWAHGDCRACVAAAVHLAAWQPDVPSRTEALLAVRAHFATDEAEIRVNGATATPAQRDEVTTFVSTLLLRLFCPETAVCTPIMPLALPAPTPPTAPTPPVTPAPALALAPTRAPPAPVSPRMARALTAHLAAFLHEDVYGDGSFLLLRVPDAACVDASHTLLVPSRALLVMCANTQLVLLHTARRA